MRIDRPPVIALDKRHLPAMVALSAEAGWNQTGDDWEMMLAAGNAIGMTAPGGHLIATAISLPFGKTFGWISMVLVTASWRKKGLATYLLGQAIEALEAPGLVPVLDATPEGAHVYRPIGFEPHYSVLRWALDDASAIGAQMPSAVNSSPLKKAGMAGVKTYDRDVFGGDRGSILDAIFARSDGQARAANRGHGYLLSRDGRTARQIGPICAEDPAVAIDMLDQALKSMTGAVFVDACDHQNAFADHLGALGFTPQRPFVRMARGRSAPFGDPGQMFALAGPELG